MRATGICLLVLVATLVTVWLRDREAVYVFGGEKVVVVNRGNLDELKRSGSAKDAFAVYSWYAARKDEGNSSRWRDVWLERKRTEAGEHAGETAGAAAPPAATCGRKTWPEILEIMGRAKENDPEAAYELFGYYTFCESDFTAAYFWAVQGGRMGDPRVTDDLVRAAENAVWSVLPYEHPAEEEAGLIPGGVLPEE